MWSVSDKNKRSCDIGYALAVGSCEGVSGVDACTVTASDVTTAFAAFNPNPLLAKVVGFFGSERPANCFAVHSLSLLRISRCLFQLPFQLSTRVILNQESKLSTPKTCANNELFTQDERLMNTA